ncbi:MAG: hypothetical protein ACRD3F_04655 [Acidobacteriaceae bacterium]
MTKNQSNATTFKQAEPPQILMAGDNARTAIILQQALSQAGFRVELAAGYHELEDLWEQQRHSMVLLEVSGPQAVEAAIHTALRLKYQDPRQFVGYIADPLLQTSGLAGDAIFPRGSDKLTRALRRHLTQL